MGRGFFLRVDDDIGVDFAKKSVRESGVDCVSVIVSVSIYVYVYVCMCVCKFYPHVCMH